MFSLFASKFLNVWISFTSLVFSISVFFKCICNDAKKRQTLLLRYENYCSPVHLSVHWILTHLWERLEQVKRKIKHLIISLPSSTNFLAGIPSAWPSNNSCILHLEVTVLISVHIKLSHSEFTPLFTNSRQLRTSKKRSDLKKTKEKLNF